jgi:hypothetical protein
MLKWVLLSLSKTHETFLSELMIHSLIHFFNSLKEKSSDIKEECPKRSSKLIMSVSNNRHTHWNKDLIPIHCNWSWDVFKHTLQCYSRRRCDEGLFQVSESCKEDVKNSLHYPGHLSIEFNEREWGPLIFLT